MATQNFPKYAPAILRIGVSLVYLWFGFQQFLHTSQWIGFIPQFIIDHSPVDASTLVHFNGAIELVFGFALIIGIFSRTSAAVLALHMAHITTIVGYDAIGVRDFGVLIGTVAAAFYGPDFLCLETYLTFRRKEEKPGVLDIVKPGLVRVSPQIAPMGGSTLTIDQIAEFIRQEQTKGSPINSIRDSLFIHGCSSSDIDKAYQIVNPANSPQH